MSDADVKYLLEKGIPTLVDQLVQGFIDNKPTKPEEFLLQFARGRGQTGTTTTDSASYSASSSSLVDRRASHRFFGATERLSTTSDLKVPGKPSVFQGTYQLTKGVYAFADSCAAGKVVASFPKTCGGQILRFEPNQSTVTVGSKLNIGLVFAGGAIPGLEYLATGLFAYLQERNTSSKLYAFLNGPKGLINNKYLLIDERTLISMQNSVGTTNIGTGTDKFGSDSFPTIQKVCNGLDLDGLVIVGNPKNNLDAVYLAEYFKANGVKTSVICSTKRYEGVVEKGVDMSFGFDSLCKHLSVVVGNVAIDAASSHSSWHIIRLNVYDATVLEVALQTHANVTILSEEVSAKKWTFLEDVVSYVCDCICVRAAQGKQYGVVLLPNGLVHFTSDLKDLVDELNVLIQKANKSHEKELKNVEGRLSSSSKRVYDRLPTWVQQMLLLGERDSHGEINLMDMQVERFLSQLCETEIERRTKEGTFTGKKLSFACHSYGYDGRCARPSQFDASLACAIGMTAAGLIEQKCTSMFATVSNLSDSSQNWEPRGVPMTSLINLDRHGDFVLQRASLNLDSYSYKAFNQMRDLWILEDLQSGPVGTLSDDDTAFFALETLERKHKIAGFKMKPHEKTMEFATLCRDIFDETSLFKASRLSYLPQLPLCLRGVFRIVSEKLHHLDPVLEILFPAVKNLPSVIFRSNSTEAVAIGRQLRIGVVLSGGPAPGGHNVIAGLFDYLHRHNPYSTLLGFLNGPSGLIAGNCMEITEENLRPFRNQGGFNMIGTSRTKIETLKDFAACESTVDRFKLDGIVICGGDDSNTNAALLADHFVKNGLKCSVVGTPKTIDADLRSEDIEMSFGFDTTTKVYTQLCATISIEALSSKNAYHFIKVMGRSASHICLECAVRARVNYAVISEEVEAKHITIKQIADEIVDLVVTRAKNGKNHGVVVVPEGLMEFTEDMKVLINEINDLLAKDKDQNKTPTITHLNASKYLSASSKTTFESLPDWLCSQLMEDRDPHGNVKVSAIESERMLAALVKSGLEKRSDYTSKYNFKYLCHFLGYQGRCNLPSDFDCNYCYTLGFMAAALVEAQKTAVIAAIKNLTMPVDMWELRGIPLATLMHTERRKGKDTPVIKKMLVDLEGPIMKHWNANKQAWALADDYPGYCIDPVTSSEVNATMLLNAGHCLKQ